MKSTKFAKGVSVLCAGVLIGWFVKPAVRPVDSTYDQPLFLLHRAPTGETRTEQARLYRFIQANGKPVTLGPPPASGEGELVLSVGGMELFATVPTAIPPVNPAP